MADLLGSDLPTDAAHEGEGEEGDDTPAFAWQDGPLLAALKEGHWVLLDELNLASQVWDTTATPWKGRYVPSHTPVRLKSRHT